MLTVHWSDIFVLTDFSQSHVNQTVPVRFLVLCEDDIVVFVQVDVSIPPWRLLPIDNIKLSLPMHTESLLYQLLIKQRKRHLIIKHCVDYYF